MSKPRVNPPPQSVAYVVAVTGPSTSIFNEFAASYESLRKLHPDLPVAVLHDGLDSAERRYFEQLDGVRCAPLAGRTPRLDALMTLPGDTLLLDTGTEVMAPLDEVFASTLPWMHAAGGLVRDDVAGLGEALESLDLASLGYDGDLFRLQLYHAAAIYVPEAFKPHLFRAKELCWQLAERSADVDDGAWRDEQLALSVVLQEAVDYDLATVGARVRSHTAHRRAQAGDWFTRVHGPRARSVVDYDLGMPYPSGLR